MRKVVPAISSSLPVWGFLPVRAARLDELKVPKPISVQSGGGTAMILATTRTKMG